MSEDTIGQGFVALHHAQSEQFDKSFCRCDPSVGMFPCEYCAVFYALKKGRELEAEVAALNEKVESLQVDFSEAESLRNSWRNRALEANTEAHLLREELSAAYAEMRKQRPTITAVFDRDVWQRAENYKEGEG